MKTFRAIAALGLAAALAAPEAGAASPPKDNPKCTPNPVFEKFPNSVYYSCDRSRFMRLELSQAKDPEKLTGAYDKLPKEGEYWGLVGCGAGNDASCDKIQHKIVRIAAMEQSVVVSADQIRKSMAETGKVVFYGIYFDTDKAVVKPESEPTLAEMAKFLKANAAAKVYIVGHTDMQGGSERNQKLSRERAAAEAGRAKNRRVEMVLR